MYSDINLITENESSKSQKTRLKRFKTISYSLLVCVALFSVLLFILNIKYSVNSVRQKQNSAVNNLSLYNESVVKLIFLNLRLGSIKKIIDGRTSYQDTIQKFLANVPPDANIESFTVSQLGFSITLRSNTLLALNTYLNSALKTAGELSFSNVSLDSLSTTSTEYVMTVSVKF